VCVRYDTIGTEIRDSLQKKSASRATTGGRGNKETAANYSDADGRYEAPRRLGLDQHRPTAKLVVQAGPGIYAKCPW
jgi:hypothetical protein